MTKYHPLPTTHESFSDRIKLLINKVGSATEIARRCGFSEGVVRSWRDGNTDPSRGRCVTMARTLGISLVWLVAGEGNVQLDVQNKTADESHTSEQMATHGLDDGAGKVSRHAVGHRPDAIDTRRLLAAMNMLQSELALADSSISLNDNPQIISELYDVLGPGGKLVDTESMVRFNQRLAARIQRERA